MTLASRIIPVLLHDGRKVMKGKQFKPWRQVGVLTQAVKVHESRGVDELIVLNVTGKPPDIALAHEFSAECFMPLTIGGGIRTADQALELIRNGADKVALNTALFTVSDIVEQIAQRAGRQAVVASLDHLGRMMMIEQGKRRTLIDVVDFALHVQQRGAGEILLNAINRDGMMNGYDLDILKAVVRKVDIPVVICGGAGTYQHMSEALKLGANGVAAGAMFQFTDATPMGAAQWLKSHGFHTRIAA